MSLRYQSIVRCWTCLCWTCLCWACLLVVMSLMVQPGRLLAASGVEQQKSTPGLTPTAPVADVALQSSGVLSGQVIDSAGTAVVGKVVRLTNGRQIWQTQTDEKGCFQLASLPGATYQLDAVEQTQLIRAWAAGTAPPHASQGLLVSQTTDVVRGQRSVSPNTNQFFRVAKQRLANPWVFGGIVATAVAIPVAIHNADDDDAPPATP